MGLVYAGNAFTLAFCLGDGRGAPRALPRCFRPAAVRAVVMVLAVFTGLYALFDLRDDLWRSSVRASSDAALLAAQTHVPALVWAVLWSPGLGGGARRWRRWSSLRSPRPSHSRGAGDDQVLGRIRYATNDPASLNWK